MSYFEHSAAKLCQGHVTGRSISDSRYSWKLTLFYFCLDRCPFRLPQKNSNEERNHDEVKPCSEVQNRLKISTALFRRSIWKTSQSVRINVGNFDRVAKTLEREVELCIFGDITVHFKKIFYNIINL